MTTVGQIEKRTQALKQGKLRELLTGGVRLV